MKDKRNIAANVRGSCYLALLIRDSQTSQTFIILMPDRRKVAMMPNTQQRTEGKLTNFGDTGKVDITMEMTSAKTNVVSEGEPNLYHNKPTGDIKDFLSRPRLISSGTFQATDAATTFAPIDIINSIYTEYDKKIYGHFAAKFDLKVRIETSVDKFHAGRYILAYIPTFVPLSTAAPYTTWSITHAATLCQVTQLQHVEIDLACDKYGELTIPFRYINRFFPLDSESTQNKYGYLYLRPYTALALGSSGASNASYKIWLSLENIEFMAVGYFQSGVAEKELEDRGPISGPLGDIAKATGALENVPVVGYYAKPATWVLDALAKSFKHFGFSSPTISSGVSTIGNGAGYYAANGDVPRPVQSLSVFQQNSVSQSPMNAKIDEMSIDYLKQIYAYRKTYSWSTSTAVDTVLVQHYVHPMIPTLQFALPDGSGNAHNWGPLGYIGNRFMHWRGSIKYKFKLVKNNFHTGKLLVAWFPYDLTRLSGVLPSNIDETYYSYRKIIDISEMNEFEITVPYISTRLFKKVTPTSNYNRTGAVYGTNFGSSQSDFTNGFISIMVLDALRAPDACPTTVSIIQEMAGGEDFHYLTPVTERMINNATAYAQPVPYYSGVFQSGDPCAIDTTDIADLKPFSHNENVHACYVTGGEKVDNLRVLLKRYTRINDVGANTDTNFIGGVRTGKSFYQTAAAVISGLKATTTSDDFRFFGPLFAFSRGSVRYKVWMPTKATNSSSFTRNQITAILIPNSLMLAADAAKSGIAFTAASAANVNNIYSETSSYASMVTSLSEALEISIPFYTSDEHYSNEHVFLDDTAASATGYDLVPYGAPAVQAWIQVQAPSTLTNYVVADRSIGEDFNFSYFISCPPVIAPYWNAF